MPERDNSGFHDFEHRGWEEVALRYDGSWAQVTTQSIGPLLDAVRIGPATRLLDVACGPGYVAAAAAARGTQVLGIDFSSVMIAEARRRYPTLEFREGDAEQLQLPDATLDAVVSNFGMLHLERPDTALSEIQRVLKPGGRIAFTVWDTSDKAVGFGILIRAIQQHGSLDVPIPPGPPFFRFSDPEETRRTLTATGFGNISVNHVDQYWQLPSADALFDVMFNSSVRNAALLRAQKPAVMGAIRQTMSREVELYKNTLPMPCVLAAADRL